MNRNTLDEFVEIGTAAPGVLVELRYATANNGFGVAFYPLGRAFLRRGTAEKLARAQAILAVQGYRLKVWDAYRPLSVQRRMWEAFPDERFVAPPSRGSRHNRGAAVDVTLVGADGREVAMPTDFDDFTDRAHADDTTAPEEARVHRDLLRAAMLSGGFATIEEEWWHFDDPEYPRYDLCDTSLEEMARGSV